MGSLPAPRQRSKKAGVDTRASKGRKLKYSEHPKLANFMFPVPLPLAAGASDLLASLFRG